MNREHQNSIDKSKYFRRGILFTRSDDKVFLVDAHDGKPSPPLDPWPSKIYLLADGQHTLKELIDLVVDKYPGGPPENYYETMDSAIGRLVEAEILLLSEKPVELPYYLSIPVEQQDHEKARRLMLDDEYQKPGSDEN